MAQRYKTRFPNNACKVFEILTKSHRLSIENELSGYKVMCAETDQDRRHRLEVLPQNDFVRSNERQQKIRDHQSTFARVPFQRMVNRLAQKHFFSLPLSLPLMYQ